MLSQSTIDHALELFAGLGDITTRKMFGGVGLQPDSEFYLARNPMQFFKPRLGVEMLSSATGKTRLPRTQLGWRHERNVK